MASREATKSFFSFNIFFPLYRNRVENAGGGGGGNLENVKKKCTYSPLISSPGRWTGNRIIFKGGLIVGRQGLS